jgi:cytochrome c oxidase subunit 1
MTGRMPSERWGQVSFWLIFVAFQVTFFPMHVLGLLGMPRRVYTYPGDLGWDGLNLLSSLGALVLATGMAIYLLNLILSARKGPLAGANPWDASTLEWATTSPPPAYNFAYAPVVEAREPLWEAGDGGLAVMEGLRADIREVLVTSAAEAKPDITEGSPKPSIWPFLAALATTGLFIGSIFDEWALVWGSIPLAIALIGWFWPQPDHSEMARVAS